MFIRVHLKTEAFVVQHHLQSIKVSLHVCVCGGGGGGEGEPGIHCSRMCTTPLKSEGYGYAPCKRLPYCASESADYSGYVQSYRIYCVIH